MPDLSSDSGSLFTVPVQLLDQGYIGTVRSTWQNCRRDRITQRAACVKQVRRAGQHNLSASCRMATKNPSKTGSLDRQLAASVGKLGRRMFSHGIMSDKLQSCCRLA